MCFASETMVFMLRLLFRRCLDMGSAMMSFRFLRFRSCLYMARVIVYIGNIHIMRDGVPYALACSLFLL